MFTIEETCTPTRVDEHKRLKLFAAFQMMHDCDDLWIDSEPYAKEVFETQHRAQLLAADFEPHRVGIEYKVAARLGESLTPLLYHDAGIYYVVLQCERGVSAVMSFE